MVKLSTRVDLGRIRMTASMKTPGIVSFIKACSLANDGLYMQVHKECY